MTTDTLVLPRHVKVVLLSVIEIRIPPPCAPCNGRLDTGLLPPVRQAPPNDGIIAGLEDWYVIPIATVINGHGQTQDGREMRVEIEQFGFVREVAPQFRFCGIHPDAHAGEVAQDRQTFAQVGPGRDPSMPGGVRSDLAHV